MSRTERMTEFDARMVEAAEADLQQLLSIQPPAEFAARVRAHIHENRESPAKRWGWMGLAVATAAAVVVAVVLRTHETLPGEQTVEMVHGPDIRVGAPPAVLGGTAPATAASTVKPARHYRATRSVTHAETPEIIIDPAMTDAIRRMAMSLRDVPPDKSVAEALQVETGGPTALPVPEPLDISELVLKPADQNGGS
jgi:hypothetical protein